MLKIDVNRAKKVGEVLTLSHGRLLREEATTENSNGAVLTQQKSNQDKSCREVNADKAVFGVIDQPDFSITRINIYLPVAATDESKADPLKTVLMLNLRLLWSQN